MEYCIWQEYVSTVPLLPFILSNTVLIVGGALLPSPLQLPMGLLTAERNIVHQHCRSFAVKTSWSILYNLFPHHLFIVRKSDISHSHPHFTCKWFISFISLNTFPIHYARPGVQTGMSGLMVMNASVVGKADFLKLAFCSMYAHQAFLLQHCCTIIVC